MGENIAFPPIPGSVQVSRAPALTHFGCDEAMLMRCAAALPHASTHTLPRSLLKSGSKTDVGSLPRKYPESPGSTSVLE